MWYAIPVVSFVGLLFVMPVDVVLALGIVVAGCAGAMWLAGKMRR